MVALHIVHISLYYNQNDFPHVAHIAAYIMHRTTGTYIIHIKAYIMTSMTALNMAHVLAYIITRIIALFMARKHILPPE
jgi:hypothetical protein